MFKLFGGRANVRLSASATALEKVAAVTRLTYVPAAVCVRLLGDLENAFFENAFFENAFFENFANFWRARSRLYQNEILQENMRSTAFFKLYKISILLHHCNLKIFAKNRFEKTAIFVKFQQNLANVAKFANFCQISKISARESGRF